MSNNQPQPSHEETDSKSFVPPRVTASIRMLLKSNPNHPLAQEYLQKKKVYDDNFQEFLKELPENRQDELPELKPIDIESLYSTFKEAYKYFRGIEFNEHLNKKPGWKYGESANLARTLCAYLTKHKSFYNSPLLNKDFNEPSLDKGLMIVGEMGTGKTSVIKTFHEMFVFSGTQPIGVKDIEGTDQFLRRYKLGFKFQNVHEMLHDYHSAVKSGHEEVFWKKHKTGLAYYDDLMTEKLAFGKEELFRELLENKYSNDCKVIISMNFVGNEDNVNLETTLDAYERRYGERLHDRSFAMYNFIELHGKSLRK